jgi:molybdate transport repressor ModE-like protein
MQPKVNVTLCGDSGTRFFGPGPCRLLEEIQRRGSLRAAAQSMEMAYTKALTLLRRAEAELGFPLTRRTIGGRGGGGSELTPEAQKFLAGYLGYRDACEASAQELFCRYFAPPVGCVVMASGEARRFGSNKLLAPLGGRPLLAWTLVALPGELDHPRVVTRSAAVAELCSALGKTCLMHDGPLQSDTIRRGLSGPEPEAWAGCLFLNGDQPLVEVQSLRAMLAAFAASPECVYRLSWQGKGGNPVLFPRRLFPALRALAGDVGGGTLLKDGEPVSLVEAGAPWELWDADTPAGLARLEQVLIQKSKGEAAQ